jgi:hypothetical protein
MSRSPIRKKPKAGSLVGSGQLERNGRRLAYSFLDRNDRGGHALENLVRSLDIASAESAPQTRGRPATWRIPTMALGFHIRSAARSGSSTGRELGPWRGSRSGRTSDRLAIFRQSYLSDPEFRPVKANGEFASPERKHVKPYVEVTLPTSSHCPLLHAQSIRRSARQSGRRSDSDRAYATTTPRGPPEVFANGAS